MTSHRLHSHTFCVIQTQFLSSSNILCSFPFAFCMWTSVWLISTPYLGPEPTHFFPPPQVSFLTSSRSEFWISLLYQKHPPPSMHCGIITACFSTSVLAYDVCKGTDHICCVLPAACIPSKKRIGDSYNIMDKRWWLEDESDYKVY